MKNKYLLLILILQSVIAFAQNSELNKNNKNFIHLKNGSIFYFNNYIEKSEPVFGTSKLKVEGKEYSLKDVQFYKNGTQFFANTAGASNACTELAERIEIGKLNVYKSYKSVYVPNAAPVGMGFGNFGGFGGTSSIKEVLYYNKNNSPLKKVNYTNLAQELVDNQESMIRLQLYKKAQTREILLYIVGTAAMFGGILTASEKTGKTSTSFTPGQGFEEVDETKIKPANLTIGLLGFTLNVVNYFVHRNKKKYLRQAIDQYNY